MPIVAGADEFGAMDGFRETAGSWHGLLRGQMVRRLTAPLELAIGIGAPEVWTELRDVCLTTRRRRRRVRETADVSAAKPGSLQKRARSGLQDNRMGETGMTACVVLSRFVTNHRVGYRCAAAKRVRRRETFPALCDFRAECWKLCRKAKLGESVVAKARNGAGTDKGCLNRKTGFALVTWLTMPANTARRRMPGPRRLSKAIQGVEFRDGTAQVLSAA